MQTATPARDEASAFDGKIETWIEDECTACVFKDLRLKRRFVALLSSIARTIGGSIPFVCQDWANTKAAYRFLSNERVSEADILAGHFNSTRDRFAATDGLVLILHDTTEFSYQRENTDAILETMVKDAGRPLRRKTLGSYLIKLARLGGYLARASDPPPGNMVIWRGLSRLADIQLGAAIAAQNCG